MSNDLNDAIERLQSKTIPEAWISPRPSNAEVFCNDFITQARGFLADLSPGHDIQATAVSPDGSSIVLHEIRPFGPNSILCIGVNLDGKKAQSTVSISAAHLKLEEVPSSAPLAKQERVGFLAQVREQPDAPESTS